MEKHELFRLYDDLLSLLRTYCSERHISEFLPMKWARGFEHYPREHRIVELPDGTRILPFAESVMNQVSAEYLQHSVYCVGPVYRNDDHGGRHLQSFYQFSFELVDADLMRLAAFTKELFGAVFARFDKPVKPFREINLLDGDFDTMVKLQIEADRAGAEIESPTIFVYKRKGVPPLCNKTLGTDFEAGIEVLLPGVGEVLSGGWRDSLLPMMLYGVTPSHESAGATIGLERLAMFLSNAKNIHAVDLA